MSVRTSVLSLAAGAAIAASANSAMAVDAYVLGFGGSQLLKFSTNSPGTVTKVADFSGGSATFGPFLDSIDIRPSTGQLYGYLDASDEMFTVNTTTGVLTKVSAANIGATTGSFVNGIDWNSTIDRLRIVSDVGDNNVYNPTTGTATAATALFYATGDAHAGTTPLIVDNAYTNSYAGATSTTQYVLDYGLHVLATLDNNLGSLHTVGNITVGGVPINFDSFAGFDIYTSAGGVNTGYAFLHSNGSDGIYTIDLTSGAATYLGAVNDAAFQDAQDGVYGLAIVPEPTSALTIAAVTSVLSFRRKR